MPEGFQQKKMTRKNDSHRAAQAAQRTRQHLRRVCTQPITEKNTGPVHKQVCVEVCREGKQAKETERNLA